MALEPLIHQFFKFNIAAKVQGHARQRLHAQFSNTKIVTVTATRHSLEHPIHALVCSIDSFEILCELSFVNFIFNHVCQMPTILVNFLVPAPYWLVLRSLDASHNAMRQEFILVCQQSCTLFGVHIQSSAKCIQNEFQGTRGRIWAPVCVHFHDVDAVFGVLLLVSS